MDSTGQSTVVGVTGAAPDPTSFDARASLARVSMRLFGHDVPPLRLDSYSIGPVLGRGASATVYHARDDETGREVALKVWDATTVHGSVLSEARALARLRHPNVVWVYGVGESGGHAYIAMELAGGGDLVSWLGRTQRGPVEVMRLLRGIALGLAAAHSEGLIHRDVKPGNVVISDEGEAKLADFGLITTRAGVHSSRPPGTPGYVPPEVLAGEPANARADQYAFGATVHHALYGHSPIVGRLPPRRDRHGARVPFWIRRMLTRTLSARAADRFASMDDVVDAIDAGLRGPPRSRALLLGAVGLGIAVGLSARFWAGDASGCERPGGERSAHDVTRQAEALAELDPPVPGPVLATIGDRALELEHRANCPEAVPAPDPRAEAILQGLIRALADGPPGARPRAARTLALLGLLDRHGPDASAQFERLGEAAAHLLLGDVPRARAALDVMPNDPGTCGTASARDLLKGWAARLDGTEAALERMESAYFAAVSCGEPGIAAIAALSLAASPDASDHPWLPLAISSGDASRLPAIRAWASLIEARRAAAQHQSTKAVAWLAWTGLWSRQAPGLPPFLAATYREVATHARSQGHTSLAREVLWAGSLVADDPYDPAAQGARCAFCSLAEPDDDRTRRCEQCPGG